MLINKKLTQKIRFLQFLILDVNFLLKNNLTYFKIILTNFPCKLIYFCIYKPIEVS